MSLRLNLTALAVALNLLAPAQAELLITEYLEGSSNNKAIELTNTGSTSLDLAGYRLALFANGRAITSTPTSELALSGSLSAGASWVITHSAANAAILAKANQTSAVANFNGDDGLVLYFGSDVVDSFGQLGVDPGTAWSSNGVTTLDMTLRRKAGIAQGRTEATSSFDPSTEYVAASRDDADGLGCSGESSCGEVPVSFVCPQEGLTSIPAIQGAGNRSPLLAADINEGTSSVVTRGRVTQVVNNLYKGFFLQDVAGDGDALTSDGLFVYSTSVPAAVKAGVEVCVQGKVKEYYQLTELAAEQMVVTDTTVMVPDAVPLQPLTDEPLPELLERHEGMRVRLMPQSDLRISRNFGYDYDAKRNNLVLSQGGPLFKATQRFPALSAEAQALAAANASNQLVVDTDTKAADGVIPWFPALDAEQNYLRVGARLGNLSGVLGYSFDHYRLLADNQITMGDVDVSGWDRTQVPALAEQGDIRVASFNVLNFFTTSVGGDANPTGTNRGATSVAEFELQRSKIVHALARLNADVIGLMEIENNGYGANSAIANLVTALNAQLADPADHYAFISSPDGQPIGSDAITVGLLYRPAHLQLDGGARILPMPSQSATAQDSSGKNVVVNSGMRDSLLQRFRVPQSDEPLTVVVNHLKSKGSACYEDYPDYVSADPLDLQGHCNALRVSAAVALSQQLAEESSDLLLLGDLNAYALEDPVRVLTDYQTKEGERAIMTASHTLLAGQPFEEQGRAVAQGLGLINLNTRFHGTASYSYSYEAELGNLDHVLASRALAAKVIGVEDWHINSAESNLLEYGSQYTGSLVKSDNPFSSSDHDPILVAIQYPPRPVGTLNLRPMALSGGEGSSIALTVSRDEGAYGAASVSYRLVHDTTSASDLRVQEGVLHWDHGDSSVQQIPVYLLEDNLLEGDEQCHLELFDASGARLGNASSQITILDRPKAMVSLGAVPARLGENVGRLSIPVVRTGDLTQPLRVQVKLDAGSARPWLDFFPLSSTSLYWPAGDASSRQVTLWILDDWFHEADETLDIRLDGIQGGIAGEHTKLQVVIEDNDHRWWPFW